MTYSCKGFINNFATVDNNPGKTSRFGELTTYARTFSTTTQSLADPASPNLEVLVFNNKDVGTTQQVLVATPYKTVQLEFAHWLYDLSPTFTARTTQQDVVAAMSMRFGDKMAEIIVDPLVYDGTRYLPTRVSFRLSIVNLPDMHTTLWFANDEFTLNYDEYEIRIVPPNSDVNVFLGSYAAVLDAVKANNAITDLQRIEEVRANDPETTVVPMEITWTDPANASQTVSTIWYAIGYGPQSASTDITLAETVKYILANSMSDESNWRLVFPDLFRVTRFAFVPQWQKPSSEGRTGLPTIYSPLLATSNVMTARTLVEELGEDLFREGTYESFNHPYRSLALVAFPGFDNRNTALSLYQVYPDYMAIESLHEDFNRQSENTKRFSNRMGELIRQSESYTLGSVPKAGYRITTVGGKLFMSTKGDNIEFMMLVKNQPA